MTILQRTTPRTHPGQRQTQGKMKLTLAYASSAVTQWVKVGSQRDLGLNSISLLLPSWAK